MLVYCSAESGVEKGYYGIEGFYTEILKAKVGKLLRSAALQDCLYSPVTIRRLAADGRDLVLTLNRSIQFLVEKRLKEGVESISKIRYGNCNGSFTER